MRTICVDDEPMALDALKTEIAKTPRIRLMQAFCDPCLALEYVRSNTVDLALLDISIRGLNGLELAKRIREISPSTRIIFTTGYGEYALDAIHMHVSGYLLKPVMARDIDRELDALEIPPHPAEPKEAGLRVQCFGNFEVFHGGKPLKFKRRKSRELFAYLVDRRGATVTTGELCAVLWPDKPDGLSQRAQLRALVADLIKTLRDCDAANAVMRTRGGVSAVQEALDCDYYRLLSGDAQAINSYRGEYMTQYAWSELTLGGLGGD